MAISRITLTAPDPRICYLCAGMGEFYVEAPRTRLGFRRVRCKRINHHVVELAINEAGNVIEALTAQGPAIDLVEAETPLF